MKTYTFRVIIEPDENDTFHGFAPVLPGCHTFGTTIEETRENLKDAIKAYVLSLLDDGEPVPDDRGFDGYETITDADFRKEEEREFAYA